MKQPPSRKEILGEGHGRGSGPVKAGPADARRSRPERLYDPGSLNYWWGYEHGRDDARGPRRPRRVSGPESCLAGCAIGFLLLGVIVALVMVVWTLIELC